MISDSKKRLVDIYNQGLEMYKNRQFQNAIQKFQEALSVDEKDGPSKLYLERCEHFIENPPPENWDGVFTMTTK